jgi:hypothetical protein
MTQLSVAALCPITPVPAPKTVLCLRCMDGRVPHPEQGVYSLAIYGGMLPIYSGEAAIAERLQAMPQRLQIAVGASPLPPPGPQPPADRDSAVGTLFAAVHMGVRTVVVLGHSDCRAVAQVHGGNPNGAPDVEDLKKAPEALHRQGARRASAVPEVDYDALSKQNVLLQMDHVRTYPFAQSPATPTAGDTPAAGAPVVSVYGAWYNLHNQQVEHYHEAAGAWLPASRSFATFPERPVSAVAQRL